MLWLMVKRDMSLLIVKKSVNLENEDSITEYNKNLFH